LSTERPKDPSLNPFRILVVGGHTERRHAVAGAIESLGHQVILEEHLARGGDRCGPHEPPAASQKWRSG
jgi:hypothetical protein